MQATINHGPFAANDSGDGNTSTASPLKLHGVCVSPVECRLHKIPGVFEDVGLAVSLGEDRVEHELLRPVLAVHLDRRLVDEANGSLAVLVNLVPDVTRQQNTL